jgi:glycosyltransferase involved in cell wall biosynthesis
MIENFIPCPVIWALGRKGYMVQTPLLAALKESATTLAVTSTNNIHKQKYAQQQQLLLAIDTPNDLRSGVKFIFYWYKVHSKIAALLQRRASVIHVIMCSPWDIFFLHALSKMHIPLIVTIHDAVQHKGEESFLMDKLRDWCIKKADLIAVLSENVAQTLQNKPNFNKPLHKVENGLVMRVEPALSARQYPTSRPIKLLFHGRIHTYKGLSLLLDAMLLLQDKNKNYSLTIAGSGNLKPYQEKIDQLKNITVCNHFLTDDELLKIITCHDVSVLPYIEASQSAVAVDALWAALPSVATPVGALPCQFRDGIDALITLKVDATSIAEAIERVCDDKILYEKLSFGAHESYKNTGPKQAAAQWINLYNQLICMNGK